MNDALKPCLARSVGAHLAAVAAFNHFNTRIARFQEELGWMVEEVLDGLSERAAH